MDNHPSTKAEITTSSLCKVLGELVAKRWILAQGKKCKKNGRKANLDIDSQSKKQDHTRAMQSVDDRQ